MRKNETLCDMIQRWEGQPQPTLVCECGHLMKFMDRSVVASPDKLVVESIFHCPLCHEDRALVQTLTPDEYSVTTRRYFHG